MGWRFRKSFKILPGVRVNLGKKGITSATIGKGGIFSTNVSSKGVRHNVNVPGTGITYQTQRTSFLSNTDNPLADEHIASNTTRNSFIILGIIFAGIFTLCGICTLSGVLNNAPVSNTAAPLKSSTFPSLSPTPSVSTKKSGKNTKKQGQLSTAAPLYGESLNNSSHSQTKKQTSSQYMLGPRGGCYYLNSSGNKTYVDHSYCN